MMDTTTIPANIVSFKDFLFKDKRNRTILILAAVAIVIQFAVFKYFYPFASYIHGDSFSYLDAAYRNLTINTYLIGYSKFIRLISIFVKPDIFLTSLQYLIIQSSSLFLLYTLFYFYKISNAVKILLLCFMLVNPLILHLANTVSSDGFFLALSLTWFTLLIWILNRPSTKLIIWHAVVIFIAFTVRYNALIYPFIAGVAFLLSELRWRTKITGILASLVLPFLFIIFTSVQYKKLSGHWQYSPFSAWQIANNAMYAYRYVDSADRKPVPEKFRKLDLMIRTFFDSTRDTKKYPSEKAMASTFYMWSPSMPLMKYRNGLFKSNPGAPELKKWASVAPFYKEYGYYILRQYPMEYIRYFIWPNVNKYYAPPTEFLTSYNSGKDTVAKIAKVWFGYRNNHVYTRFKNKTNISLTYFPILSGIINLVMLIGLICYVLLKGWHYNRSFHKLFLSGIAVWIVNAVFTIGASSAALRFQSFPLLLTTIFAGLLVDWMIQLMRSMKNTTIHISKEERTLQQAIVQ